MEPNRKRRVCIYWIVSANSLERRYTIEKLGLPEHVSVNGETFCDVDDEQYRCLLIAASKKWLALRNKK